MVAAIERIKYKHILKLSVRYIPSAQNRTADLLSRNRIPSWLECRGTRIRPCMSPLVRLLHVNNLAPAWSRVISNNHNLA